MKKLLLLSTVLLALAVMNSSVNAAEITPDSDSYSFGSTSEMSASSTYDVEPPEDDSLADTGTNTTFIIIGAVSLLVVGGIVTRRTLKA